MDNTSFTNGAAGDGGRPGTPASLLAGRAEPAPGAATCSGMALKRPAEAIPGLGVLLQQQRGREVLRARGIVPLGRVLIHGPAGSGRELLARAVAEELHLRVYHINLRELAAEDHDVVEGALSALAQDAGRVRAAYLLEGVDMLDAGGPARAAMLLRRLLDQPRPSDSLLVCLAEGEVSPSLASRFDLVWETEAGPG